jgi:hypothetical protein
MTLDNQGTIDPVINGGPYLAYAWLLISTARTCFIR